MSTLAPRSVDFHMHFGGKTLPLLPGTLIHQHHTPHKIHDVVYQASNVRLCLLLRFSLSVLYIIMMMVILISFIYDRNNITFLKSHHACY